MDGWPGRQELDEWRRELAGDWFTATPYLAHALHRRVGSERYVAMAPRLASFAHTMVSVVEPAVAEMERHRDLPASVPYDGTGNHVASVAFHPAHRTAGRAVWASGLPELGRAGDDCFEPAALFYLLSHAGEGGHACPLVCTVGLARALVHRGPDELCRRFHDRLVDTDYDRAWRGSQFLTEVQGGSDVGANATVAVPDAAQPGAWRLTGEKWFCSVADAELFAVTARPQGAPAGTAGLGCFLVPRWLDGEGRRPNGFRIRRLKDKLGTRALASAELEFEGALGWPIGPVEEGFRTAVDELLNTSRWMNALGSTGIMRRAYLEAAGYARHRRAFGGAIGSHPIVREQLALMKAEERAALSSTLLLTGLVERLATGDATADDRSAHRFLVNANKYVTSVAATDVVHQGIELLGGNGTIEDFSPLPRLYRDAIVYESWEGTHNVLCAQVQRDCSRLGLLGPVAALARRELASVREPGGRDAADVDRAIETTVGRLAAAAGREPPSAGAAHFRRHLGRLVRALQAAVLLADAAAVPGDAGEEHRAVAALFVRRHLVPGHDPEDDPEWAGLVEAALAGDAG